MKLLKGLCQTDFQNPVWSWKIKNSLELWMIFCKFLLNMTSFINILVSQYAMQLHQCLKTISVKVDAAIIKITNCPFKLHVIKCGVCLPRGFWNVLVHAVAKAFYIIQTSLILWEFLCAFMPCKSIQTPWNYYYFYCSQWNHRSLCSLHWWSNISFLFVVFLHIQMWEAWHTFMFTSPNQCFVEQLFATIKAGNVWNSSVQEEIRFAEKNWRTNRIMKTKEYSRKVRDTFRCPKGF